MQLWACDCYRVISGFSGTVNALVLRNLNITACRLLSHKVHMRTDLRCRGRFQWGGRDDAQESFEWDSKTVRDNNSHQFLAVCQALVKGFARIC